MANKRPPRPRKNTVWNAEAIRALREHLDLTQQQMAEELEVRQQTISEWETNTHTPHRPTQKVLTMLAERAGFDYKTDAQPTEPEAPAEA
ncbi:MAG: helix-turn-helix transcriptional regulator [Chloroflexales bacterium]|nr:helix-turn-helix transcriptional regulator [Chloroflexales bacterium]